MAKSYLGQANLPRGFRNNNPGNIRYSAANDWVGKIPYSQNTDAGKEFEQFKELRYGIRAKLVILYNDIKSGKTITQLISKYAPAFENDTNAYIRTVSTQLGINANIKLELSEENLIGLAKAISLVENGTKYTHLVTDQDYRDALAIFDKPLKKKVQTLG